MHTSKGVFFCFCFFLVLSFASRRQDKMFGGGGSSVLCGLFCFFSAFILCRLTLLLFLHWFLKLRLIKLVLIAAFACEAGISYIHLIF